MRCLKLKVGSGTVLEVLEVPHRSEIQMFPFSGITAYPSDVMSTKSHCFPIPKYELITTEHFPNGTKCWQICIGNVYLRIVKKPSIMLSC